MALYAWVVGVPILIIAVIGELLVDTPEKKALLSIVSFCKLKPTQNLAGTIYDVVSLSILSNSRVLIDIALLLLKIEPIARLNSFSTPARFCSVDNAFVGMQFPKFGENNHHF